MLLFGFFKITTTAATTATAAKIATTAAAATTTTVATTTVATTIEKLVPSSATSIFSCSPFFVLGVGENQDGGVIHLFV